VAERLLARLREHAGITASGYLCPPERIYGGYDTFIWGFRLAGAPPAWQGPLIVRVFRDSDGARRARFEGAAQTAIAQQAFPCPRPLYVEADSDVLGGAFLIMPRVPGVPLLSAALRPSRLIFRLARLVAESHAQLHRLDPSRMLNQLTEAGFDGSALKKGLWLPQLHRDVESGPYERFEAGLRWLERHQPEPVPDVICHLDFHPINILTEDGKVTGVIDWANASVGDPAADVGTSWVLMAMGPIGDGWLAPLIDFGRRLMADRYVASYRSMIPIPRERIRYYEAQRCFAAMLHVAMRRTSGEGPERGQYAWDQPAQVRMMTGHFKRVSGVALPLQETAAPI